MNQKLKTFLLGSAEAAGVGFVIGVGSLWLKPEDVILTWAGISSAGILGAKFGVIYLIAFLRKNVGFREVWTPERRYVEGLK